MNISTDWTMWNYVLTLVVSVYGSALFGWWAKRAGNPSAVFLYVMGIFIAVGWSMGIAMYGRYQEYYVIGWNEENNFIRDSVLWTFRTLPTTLVLLSLCIHMSYRAFIKSKHRATDGEALSYEQIKDKLGTSESARIVSEAAIIAAEVVALASKDAANRVAMAAKEAAKNAKRTSDHIVEAIKGIHQRRNED